MHEIARSTLPGELVFDIGAHLGDKADWFVRRGVRVVAVEPQPQIAEQLRRRFHGEPRVVVLEKGVSQTRGVQLMHVNAAIPSISTFSEQWKTGRFRNMEWDELISVEMTTFDALIAEYGSPRYIKLDVEGYEKQALLGLSRRTGAISFEFTSEFLENARDTLWYLRGLGYTSFNYSLGENENLELEQWASIDSILPALTAASVADSDAWGDIYLF